MTTSAGLSVPHPENAERRAAITRDIQAATGLDEAILERPVRVFYATARQDALIGHLFDGVQDWAKHIAKISTFWNSVALLTGNYHGRPPAAHFRLPRTRAHFTRWLVLFEQTARMTCSAAGADHLMEKAHRIAQSLEIGLAVGRGALPPRAGARNA